MDETPQQPKSNNSMIRLIVTTILIFIFISIGTVIAILYARGYRINDRTIIAGTGLVVFTSSPDGARVLINGHFTTATNNTLNLAPGNYNIRIEKDGYFPWTKYIIVRNERVTEANATLFPIAPQLDSVTISGATNPVIDPSGTLIAYTTSASLTQNSGIYILNMNAKPILSLGGLNTQITDDSLDKFSTSLLSFSPDGTQLIASVSGDLGTTQYLISPNGFNQNPSDITATFSQTQSAWQQESIDRQKKLLDSLPIKVRTLATKYFSNMSYSPEQSRIFYVASVSATLPLLKNPQPISVNSTPENRSIKEGSAYVYDVEDDRNYLLYAKESGKTLPHFVWDPDSSHLIFVIDKTINIIEYDGQNKTTVYAGPFVDDYVYPWPDGSSIVILTNLNIPGVPNNLYRIGLK